MRTTVMLAGPWKPSLGSPKASIGCSLGVAGDTENTLNGLTPAYANEARKRVFLGGQNTA